MSPILAPVVCLVARCDAKRARRCRQGRPGVPAFLTAGMAAPCAVATTVGRGALTCEQRKDNFSDSSGLQLVFSW